MTKQLYKLDWVVLFLMNILLHSSRNNKIYTFSHFSSSFCLISCEFHDNSWELLLQITSIDLFVCTEALRAHHDPVTFSFTEMGSNAKQNQCCVWQNKSCVFDLVCFAQHNFTDSLMVSIIGLKHLQTAEQKN